MSFTNLVPVWLKSCALRCLRPREVFSILDLTCSRELLLAAGGSLQHRAMLSYARTLYWLIYLPTYHVQPSPGHLWPTVPQSHHLQTSLPWGSLGSASPSQDSAVSVGKGGMGEIKLSMWPLFWKKTVTLRKLHKGLHMFSIFLLFQFIIWTVSMSVRAVTDEKRRQKLCLPSSSS